MDRWDLLLLGISGYVAVTALVRLMAKRRNQVIQQMHRDVEGQVAAQAKKKVETSDTKEEQNVA